MLRLVPLVCILTVMAGCMQLYQDEIADERSASAPTVEFVDDEPGDRFRVMHAESGLDWSEFNVTGNKPAFVRLNDGTILPFSPSKPARLGGGMVQGGDKLDFCVARDGPLEAKLLYVPDNLIVHAFAFASVSTHEWCR